MRFSTNLSAFLVLFLGSLACGQTRGPAEINVPTGRLASVPIVLDADESDYVILGANVDGLREYDPDPKKLRLRVIGYEPGVAWIVVSSQKGGKLQGVYTCKVIVGGGPLPPGPLPPTPTPPGPTPTPPGPTPPPDPPGPAPPIPAAGLHVLMVYEDKELPKLPPGQYSVLYAKAVRDYLNAKCAAGPDGKTKQWRTWDKDTNATGESKLWQDALARPRQRTPWIIISNGKTGYEGPLPNSVEDALKLLKIYGGE
jgi:hypothetical protein